MVDLLSAISVYLVFLTFLFNSIEKEIQKSLDLIKPEKEQQKKLKQYKKEVREILFIKSLPISIIYIVSFYVLLPMTINILKESSFNIIDFDALNTFFLFIEVGLFGLSLYAISKTYKLCMKLYK